jgi:glycosyltransferase involved in cell wall biosynthesis
MTHSDLARLYRACDIAVWPRQESMSMLDAAATGLPLIVSAAIGESARVSGNGAFYDENDPATMAGVLTSLASRPDRQRLGAAGRAKMIEHFSWTLIAKSIEADYAAACGGTSPVSDLGSL